MVTFEKWPLRCEGDGCPHVPTLHMRVYSREFGAIGWRYCENCFHKHVALIDALNEKLSSTRQSVRGGR